MQDAKAEDRGAEERRGPEADLDAEKALAAPVDVAEVEQQRRLVEREAHAGAEGGRQRSLDALLTRDQRAGAAPESEQDAGDEMVDVMPADPDVPERPPAAADPGGREPHEGERAHETGEDVEEHELAARRCPIALDHDGHRVLRRLSRGAERGRGCRLVPGLAGTTAPEPDHLSGDHAPRRRHGDPGEPQSDPIGAAGVSVADEGRARKPHAPMIAAAKDGPRSAPRCRA